MISDQSNIGRKQIFEELPTPDKVKEGMLQKFTYKGIFIIVKLLLDIRSNMVQISQGKKIFSREHKKTVFKKPDNPIKGLDSIKLKEGSVKKGGVNNVEDVTKPDFKPKGQGGKSDEETKS